MGRNSGDRGNADGDQKWELLPFWKGKRRTPGTGRPSGLRGVVRARRAYKRRANVEAAQWRWGRNNNKKRLAVGAGRAARQAMLRRRIVSCVGAGLFSYGFADHVRSVSGLLGMGRGRGVRAAGPKCIPPTPRRIVVATTKTSALSIPVARRELARSSKCVAEEANSRRSGHRGQRARVAAGGPRRPVGSAAGGDHSRDDSAGADG